MESLECFLTSIIIVDIFVGGWGVPEEISSIEDIRSFFASLKVYKPLPMWILRILDVLEENNVPFCYDSSRFGTSFVFSLNDYLS